MAEDKKSFIAYSDWHGVFKALPNDVAGKLIKHIFSYVNDENPTTEDYIINALFEQIKSTLKRDLHKWEEQKIQRSEAGKKSAELRKLNTTSVNERSTSDNENQRKPTVSVNVNVNDNVIKEKKVIKEIDYSFLQNEPKILIDAFRKWLQYKKEIKNHYKSQVSTETTFNHLKNLSGLNIDNAMKIVNNSIANQYKGLFPLKENQTQPLQNVSPPSQYKRHEL
jgi:hypothetical protein